MIATTRSVALLYEGGSRTRTGIETRLSDAPSFNSLASLCVNIGKCTFSLIGHDQFNKPAATLYRSSDEVFLLLLLFSKQSNSDYLKRKISGVSEFKLK